jgi:hypothetical protein
MNNNNCFIYTEESKLIIRKPNGLEYEFDNVDKPELGFDYDVIVYDDIEVKILNWDDAKGGFDSQEHIPLNASDMDAIENYIEHSEPPMGVSLSNQYCQRITEFCVEQCDNTCEVSGFDNLTEVLIAGREGSNHPQRSNARSVLEFCDAIASISEQLQMDIQSTREDHLKSLDEYISFIPKAQVAIDAPR